MTFVRGNRAIRDHFEDGKDLHLFRYVTKGRVRYEGQMVYTGFEFRQGPDVEGKERKIIVFRLTPIEAFSEIPRQDETIHKLIQEETLADLRQAAAHHSNETPSKSTRNVTVYERSLAIKAYTRKRAEGMCEACRTPAPFVTSSGDPYIEIHHLRRLSDGGPDNPEWVIGVCPNCHRRAHYGHDGVDFNKHLIEVVRSIEKRAISL